jgi:uncharacterized membrane protein YphA (DoxX/SURF4 family)
MIDQINKSDIQDFAFRLMFSSIFLGLGMEHLFQDEIIQKFMPDWIAYKRLASIACGIILITGSASIITGYRIRSAAIMLIFFLITVTGIIHGPELFKSPETLPPEWTWLWQVFQRSNFVKNICLLGVCIHLLHYEPGKITIRRYIENLKK